MLDVLKKIGSLLDGRGRRQVLVLLILSSISAGLELCGVTSALPFMALAANPQLSHAPGWLLQKTTLAGLGLIILVALTLSNVVTGLSLWLGFRFAHELQTRMSVHLLRLYLHQPFRWHLEHHPGTLAHNLAQARNLVGTSFNPAVQLISRFATISMLVATLVWLNPVGTVLGLLVLLAIYGTVYVVCRRQLLRACTREWFLAERLARTSSEPLAGIKQVRLAALEPHYLKIKADLMKELGQTQGRKLLSTELPRLAIQTLTYSSMLGLVIYLVYRHGGGSEIIGQISLYALVGYRLVPQIQQCFQSLGQLESGRAALERLYPDLSRPAPGPPGEGTRLPLRESIELRQVDFQYADDLVLQAVDLTIPRGACVGFVGPTGKGKTTLVNLLVGLLEPERGQLLIDGQALTPGQLRAYQRNIGYVPQDIYLIDDTIRANIALGEETINEESLRAAMKAARVEEFGLQHHEPIGDRGCRLSGGQRQRLGIARALYRNPEILVFDEATSALDGETEAEVMKAITDLAGQRTLLIVAHRLTTLQACDRIYRIDGRGIARA